MNTMHLSNSKYRRQKTYVRVENSKNKTKQNNFKTTKSVYVLGTKITILPLCQSKEHTTIGFLMKNPIEMCASFSIRYGKKDWKFERKQQTQNSHTQKSKIEQL